MDRIGRNPNRREALADAAIAVLARAGARGLTYRAIDTAADVPAGTASNYFRNREELVNQTAERIHVRLTPGADELEVVRRQPASRDLVVSMMQALVRRIHDDPTTYLALQELRMEAARTPELRRILTRTTLESIEYEAQTFHDLGLPGDRTTVSLIHLAMNGLLAQLLTLPDTLTPDSADHLVHTLITQLIPE